MQEQQQQQQQHHLAGGGGEGGTTAGLGVSETNAPAARAKWMLVSGTPKKPTVMPPPSYISPKKQRHVDQMHVAFDPSVLLEEGNHLGGNPRPQGGGKGKRKKKATPLLACTPDQLLKEVAKRMIRHNHGQPLDSSLMMDEATNYTMWLNDITESYRLRAALVLGD